MYKSSKLYYKRARDLLQKAYTITDLFDPNQPPTSLDTSGRGSVNSSLQIGFHYEDPSVVIGEDSKIVTEQSMETKGCDDDSLLPRVEVPYLPAMGSKHKYTLVLDLDETLIHYVDSSVNDAQIHYPNINLEGSNVPEYLIRPGAREFLIEMGQYYEIVIFTAAMQDYADYILD